MHQVECIIKWDSRPIFGKFRLSDRFLLEQVAGPEGEFTFAYLGIEDDVRFFQEASSTIQLFLLTSALSNDVIATHYNVIGTDLSRLEDLGKHRVAYNTAVSYTHLTLPTTPYV